MNPGMLIASNISARSLSQRFFSINKTICKTADIKNVTIFGGGTMGIGICEVTARAGDNVTLVDLNENFLRKTKNSIEKRLKRFSEKKFKDDRSKGEEFLGEVLSRISFEGDSHKAVDDADLVIEAIVEDLGIKQKLFSDLDKAAPKKCIFTTNTSALLVSDVASMVKRKDRFGALHFFSPVRARPLVEVVRIAETSNSTNEKLLEWVKSIKKVPLPCKDTPGFIVNRLLIPYIMEAIRFVERGDAELKYVDTGMRLGAAHAIGPFELCDQVGNDVILLVLEGFSKRFPNNPNYGVPKILQKMVKDGKLGQKTGEGWYKYDQYGQKIAGN